MDSPGLWVSYIHIFYTLAFVSLAFPKVFSGAGDNGWKMPSSCCFVEECIPFVLARDRKGIKIIGGNFTAELYNNALLILLEGICFVEDSKLGGIGL